MNIKRPSTGVIRVECAVSKVNERRTIKIQPNLRAWLEKFPLDLIRTVEDPAASFGPYESRTPNPLFVGIDIGRRKDLTVAWILERVAGVLWTRAILILENTPFPDQEAILAERVARARYIAIDSTGMGGPISEHLARRLGDYKLEAVNFTNDRKRELFSRAKKAFQSQKVRIPSDSKLRDDLASIQHIVTPQGLVKFIAARTRDGHADRAGPGHARRREDPPGHGHFRAKPGQGWRESKEAPADANTFCGGLESKLTNQNYSYLRMPQ